MFVDWLYFCFIPSRSLSFSFAYWFTCVQSNRHLDIASLLIKHNTQVNATDRWGFTPLHEAAQKGRTQLCALLLNHGADPNLKNHENQTALDLATAEDVRCLLLDATAPTTVSGPTKSPIGIHSIGSAAVSSSVSSVSSVSTKVNSAIPVSPKLDCSIPSTYLYLSAMRLTRLTYQAALWLRKLMVTYHLLGDQFIPRVVI